MTELHDRGGTAVSASPGAGGEHLSGMDEQSEEIARNALADSVFVRTAAVFGDFYGFVGRVFVQMFTRRFQFREFVAQAWFIITVSFAPALLVSIPFCVVIIFQVNQLLIQIGAIDLARQMGVITEDRRQALYEEMQPLKPTDTDGTMNGGAV